MRPGTRPERLSIGLEPRRMVQSDALDEELRPHVHGFADALAEELLRDAADVADILAEELRPHAHGFAGALAEELLRDAADVAEDLAEARVAPWGLSLHSIQDP